MTTTPRWPQHPVKRPPVGDVVAALGGGRSTALVARAAVREAVSRGARVRFLHVLPQGLSDEDRAEREEATFGVALRALREAPRLPVTFEVVVGAPGPTYVRSCATAAALVLASDEAGEIVRQCQAEATCDVLTVHADSAHGVS